MKIVKVVISLALICVLFCGCSGNQSLSDLTIVEAVGIDFDKNNTQISLQYLNLAKGGGTTDGLSGGITSVAVGTSNSISNAISSTSSALSQEIFFGQNKLIVFGKKYVQNGIDKGLDYLLRSVDSRPDVMVAISDDKAEDVIRSAETDARIPAESLYDLIETGEKNGFSAVVCVSDILNLYSDNTSDIYLPVISAGEKSCKCSGIAIFSDEKYAATLDDNQCLGFMILKNKIKTGFVNISDEKLGKVSLEITSSKSKNKMQVTQNGYIFNCKIKLGLTLDEVENGVTVAIDQSKIKTVEKLVNKRVEDICKSTFNACVLAKSDPLMLGRYLAKADNQAYEKVKDNWKNELDKIQINVSVDSKLEKVNDTALRG